MRHTIVIAILALFAGDARSEPRRAKLATQADLDRLEKRVDDQQRLLEKLVKLQQQYLSALVALMPDPGAATPTTSPPAVAAIEPKPADTEPKPEPKPVSKPKKPAKPEAKGAGTIVGKIAGGGGEAFVYVEDVVASAGGTAKMTQEGRQFAPHVLAVQKGTRVEFPNLDAVFHNVFSVTPDASFDLGSYRQGESRSVTMTKPGVVTVYCNMHPNMVGYILVTPSALVARVGSDGFYRLTNVPAGRHKLVAWAPNAKPVTTDVEVGDAETATIELELKRGRTAPHTNKDGMAYGSYKE